MNSPLRSCSLSNDEILRYRVRGSGPTKLVLLHGLAARSETWTDLIPLFHPDRYTLYILDLLGSGESAKPRRADYTIRAHSLRLLDFLEHKGLSQVTLIGHSMGGAVVLLAAIEAQQTQRESLLKSVVVVAGPGYLQSLPLIARVFRLPLAGPLFISLYAPTAWVKVGLRAAYHDQRLVDSEHVARYAPCYQDREARRALVATCRQLVPPDCDAISACYGELRVPMLLLWGRQDRIVPLSQGERLEKAIPGARLVVLEECGHNPQEEKAAETFAIMESFLRQGGTQPRQE
jgi:pimeloyl-ACP methyl ester carboxylesterase